MTTFRFSPTLAAGLAAFGGVAIALHTPYIPFLPACLVGLALALAAGCRQAPFDDFIAGVALAYLGWAALYAVFGRQDMPLAWFILVPLLFIPTCLAAIGGFMAGRLLARMRAARRKGA